MNINDMTNNKIKTVLLIITDSMMISVVHFQVTQMSLISTLNKMLPEVEYLYYMASLTPCCFYVLAIHIISAL